MIQHFQKHLPSKTDEISSEEETHRRELSVFKDPFNKAHIERIGIVYRRPLFEQNHIWEATVEFRNGYTEGKQSTPQCNTWDELMVHMKQIYDSLSVKPQ